MKNTNGILQGNLAKALLHMAVPIFAMNLINALYNVIDTFWVGQLGELQLGAVSLVGPIMFCAFSASAGLSAAGIAIISTKLGAKLYEEACRFATALMYFAILCAILIAAGSIIFIDPILHWLDTPAEIYRDTYAYLFGISFDYIGMLQLTIYMAVRQSSGDSKSGVKLNAIASLINVILDPILIFGFHMGVGGAAAATVICKWVVMPLAYRVLYDKKEAVHIDFKRYPLRLDDAKTILKICIPAASGNFLESLGFVVMNKYIVYYGAVAISAYGVGEKLTNIAYIPINSFGQILATFVGQNLGAHNAERARESYHTAMKFVIFFSIVMTILGMLVIIPFTKVFVPDASAQFIEIVVQYTFFALLTSVFMGWYMNLCGVFNGSGHTNYTFFLSMLRLWGFRVPMILLFHRYTDLGITGIWVAMIISNILECIVGQSVYMRHNWENSNLITNQKTCREQE